MTVRCHVTLFAKPFSTCDASRLHFATWWSHNTYLQRFWVNYNISLTWIKAIWGWFPLLTMIPVRSQWGRYNLPRRLWKIGTSTRCFTGWWLKNPSEKYEIQMGLLFPIYRKLKFMFQTTNQFCDYIPSGNLLHNYGKSRFSSWMFPWKMLDLSIVM